MSTFWSTWVIVLAVITFGVSFFLFCWAPWVKVPTNPDSTTTHVWAHGVLREAVRPLPRWWQAVSFAMFAVAALYVLLYPGLGNFRGLLGWTSEQALAQDAAAQEARMAALAERLGSAPMHELVADDEAVRIGRRLFLDNCSACHGREGHGQAALGAPDLLDRDWLYGGSAEAVMTSILDGRQGVMPPFGATLSNAEVVNVAHYVASLSGSARDPVKAALGKSVFSACAACHGARGEGNPALGAPNLTDRVWLHGSATEAIVKSVRDGRQGAMPAWRDRLGEPGARAITAWIGRHGGLADSAR
ncbi:MAG: cytochrome-c oxidase, cbb3-type subunit III [Lautropia sp.]